MMRVIVTGGAGFIGANTIEALNQRGVTDILVVDDLGRGEKWRNLVGLEFADVMPIDDFRYAIRHDAVKTVDAVIHLGACSSTTETNADYLLDNNMRYSRELCEWCVEKGARFVYASSAATYGDGSAGYSDELERLAELRPLNMYGFSKHLFDLWVLRQGLFDRVAGIKYFNVYGPREAHKGEMRSVVHKAWGQIRERGVLRLFRSHRPDYADGEQRRDFVWVRDAVEVTLFLVEHAELGGLFNCGTGRARTWNDLARAVFAAMGREPAIEYVDMPPELRDTYQYHTEADIRRLRDSGYDAPFADIEEGVSDYVRRLERGEVR
ncbi:MAG: ADP-glyceromanno-heptose 6-epimerase [Kiritimatiellae bacterium]|nr:ADP-glyceromanno-heptose 6-epimerase [Kiritimatiellia bacterium]